MDRPTRVKYIDNCYRFLALLHVVIYTAPVMVPDRAADDEDAPTADPDHTATAPPVEGDLIRSVSQGMHRAGADLGIHPLSLDAVLVSYLRLASRFGIFSYGPVTLDLGIVEDAVARGGAAADHPLSDQEHATRSQFWNTVAAEQRQSGRRAIDELHILLALMRVHVGVVGRIFGELGVTAGEVRAYAQSRRTAPPPSQDPTLEKLFTPEEAATYLGVHVQTVRAWIRSGRLPASRLAGQRALRVRASHLGQVLEPIQPDRA